MVRTYGYEQRKVGHPEYLALDVRLEDGSSQLFWHYELEEVPEP
jgi:hypothetical protein